MTSASFILENRNEKELESGIRDKDVQLVVSNAEFARDTLQWAADYFVQKKNVNDAVDWAKQGRDLAASVAKTAAAKEFDAAYESFGDLKKNCKRCHDAYKPPSL